MSRTKVAPPPGVSSRRRFPPCACRISRETARPRPGALAGRLRGEEPVEDLRLHLGRDAGPIVDDLDVDHLPAPAGAHGEVPALASGLHRLPRVPQEVHQHLTEAVRVGRDAGQVGLEVPDELDPGHGALGSLEVHRLLDQGIEVDGLERGRARLGHGQELAHEALGTLGGVDDLAGPFAAGPVGPRIGLDHLRERHQRRERGIDVVDQPGHALADRRETLDLHEVRARLADLILEGARHRGPVLARQRHPDLAGQALQDPQLLGRQIEPGVIPRQRQEAARAGLAGGDGEHEPRRGRVAEPGRRARERDPRDPGGLAVLEQAGQLVGQRERGSFERSLVERTGVPPRDRGEGGAVGRGREERQRLAGAERRRQPRHHGSERPRRLGARHERVDDSQQRLDGAGASLGALEETRLVDREGCRAGEQPEDGEVARGEAGPVREAVGVENPHHPAAHLERDRHGRLDAASLGDEVRESREVVALAQQHRAAGLGYPARHAFAQARSLLPRLGLAGRGACGGRHAQVVPLHEHQRGLVGAQRVGGPVDDVAEQLVGGDLVREEAERELLDPEDLVPPLATLASGPRP